MAGPEVDRFIQYFRHAIRLHGYGYDLGGRYKNETVVLAKNLCD